MPKIQDRKEILKRTKLKKVSDIKVLNNINIDNHAGVIITCIAVGRGGSPPPAVPPEVIAIVRKALFEG